MKKRKGWICPKCGAVYSPDVTECSRCNAGIFVYTQPPWWIMYPYYHVPYPRPYVSVPSVWIEWDSVTDSVTTSSVEAPATDTLMQRWVRGGQR